MKKNIFSFLIAAVVLVSPVVVMAHSLTTTLDFYGILAYDPEGELNFPESFVPNIDGPFSTNESLRNTLNAEAPYYGIAALAYEFDFNLPPWEQSFDSWWLEFELYADHSIDGSLPADPIFGDMIEFGPTSLENIFGGNSKEDVINFLTLIPQTGDFGVGSFYIDGNLHGGEIYAALTDDILGDRAFELEFTGNVSLTAHHDEAPIPEPSTMLLFGSGLAGLAAWRYRKNVKA